MRYVGGKYRIAKELATIIGMFKPTVYWEPFVGAGNVIQHINAPVRIGSDLDPHIASFLECVRDGWLPPVNVSEEEYQTWKTYEPLSRESYATKAAIGYGCSFGGKWFGGYARDPNSDRNYARAVHNQSREMRSRLSDVRFMNQSFRDGIPEGVDLVYCDPPYANTTNCGARQTFDSDFFWMWCRAVAMRGVTVLVTEFSAPPFALEIWRKEKFTDLKRKDGNKVMTERLFLVRAA